MIEINVVRMDYPFLLKCWNYPELFKTVKVYTIVLIILTYWLINRFVDEITEWVNVVFSLLFHIKFSVEEGEANATELKGMFIQTKIAKLR